MKKKKHDKSTLKQGALILGIFLFVIGLGLILQGIFDINKDHTPSCQLEESHIIEVKLSPFDWEYIEYSVNDFYIDEKRISEFYWSKLCRDLLKVRLNETLSKSENLWLDTEWPWFSEYEIELLCSYNIYWGEEGDFYGKVIESGEEFFNTEELLLAQEKRPLRYNESLVSITWREEFQETRLLNDNPDYSVILKLKLNESIDVCG